MITPEFQIVGDGINSTFTVAYQAGLGTYVPQRVARFWGKNGRADIQPKAVTLNGTWVTINLWSVPNLGEVIVVAVEAE